MYESSIMQFNMQNYHLNSGVSSTLDNTHVPKIIHEVMSYSRLEDGCIGKNDSPKER